MKKLLTILLFCVCTAEGQSIAQAKSNLFYPDQTGHTLQEPAWVTTTAIATAMGSPITGDITNSRIITNLTGSNISSVTVGGQWTMPSYSSFAVMPNSKNPILEFIDRQITSNGSTVTLQSTSFSATYSSILPVSETNGVWIAQRAVYSEKIFGNGDIPWTQITAPTISTGVVSELNTFANNASNNAIGAYKINLYNGNALQLATTDVQSAIIGFSRPSNTSIILSGESVRVPGSFEADGRISSKTGFTITSAGNTSVINLQSTGMMTADGDYNDFWGIRYGGILSKSASSALVMETNRSGGMMFRAYSISNYETSIGFSLNSSMMLDIKTAGLVIGGGEPLPSAIVTVNSDNKMLVLPRLFDDAILHLPPIEGGLVYSKDQKALVFADGKKWQIIKKTKELRELTVSKKRNFIPLNEQ